MNKFTDLEEVCCWEVNSEIETDRVAEKIFSWIQFTHEVILLIGDLGAGKTYLAQKLITLYGVEELITSPTFNLINHYPTKKNDIIHADFYRLQNEAELNDLDIFDALDKPGLVLIEWGERFPSLCSLATILIKLKITSLKKRSIQFSRKKII